MTTTKKTLLTMVMEGFQRWISTVVVTTVIKSLGLLVIVKNHR